MMTIRNLPFYVGETIRPRAARTNAVPISEPGKSEKKVLFAILGKGAYIIQNIWFDEEERAPLVNLFGVNGAYKAEEFEH